MTEVIIPEERWRMLMSDPAAELTNAEIATGWHWCWEWDGLLIGPGMKEMELCRCDE